MNYDLYMSGFSKSKTVRTKVGPSVKRNTEELSEKNLGSWSVVLGSVQRFQVGETMTGSKILQVLYGLSIFVPML